MGWEPCTHKVARDHIVLAATRTSGAIWRCSRCRAKGEWDEGWRYYGNIECKRCDQAVVDRVACPKCAAGV